MNPRMGSILAFPCGLHSRIHSTTRNNTLLNYLQTTKLSIVQAKELVAELCRNFYSWGWVSGTGGGISIKTECGKIVMAPSGVQKERMLPEDMFVLDSAGDGTIFSSF